MTRRNDRDPKKPNPATGATVPGQEAGKIRADHVKHYQHAANRAISSYSVGPDMIVMSIAFSERVLA